MNQDILDRIAALLRDQQCSITAQEIASEHLRLSTAGSAASGALVRAMLSKDARFKENATGVWSLALEQEQLNPPVVLCLIEVPQAAQQTPWLWRVSAKLWGCANEAVVTHSGQDSTSELETVWQWLSQYPAACDRPGMLSRWMGARERLHALSEVEQPLIDLRAWSKVVASTKEKSRSAEHGAKASGIHATAAGGESQVREEGRSGAAGMQVDPTDRSDVFERVAGSLQEIVEIANDRHLTSWSDIALLPSVLKQEATDRVWNHGWTFTAQEVQDLPEEPGIYRFTAGDGSLLYVGKAKNLRTRVASYFRPLEEKSSRRATFLEEIRSLEYETTGTELEALILEARAIREENPRWNTQLAVHESRASNALVDEDMVLLLPTAVGGHRLFAFSGERLAMGSVTALEADRIRDALRVFYVEGGSLPEIQEVEGPERALARRWLKRDWQGSTVLRLTDFPTYAAVAGEVQRICAPGSGAGGTLGGSVGDMDGRGDRSSGTAVASDPSTIAAIVRGSADPR